MSANTLPFEFGNRSSSLAHLADLGNVYFSGASAYRLVRCVTTALLLTAQGKFVDENSVTTLTYASSALSAVTSAKPLGLTSTAQQSIAIGDFFLVQVQGVGTVVGANTVTIATAVTTAAGGLVANVTGTFAGNVPPTIVGTALANAAGANATIRLQNLI